MAARFMLCRARAGMNTCIEGIATREIAIDPKAIQRRLVLSTTKCSADRRTARNRDHLFGFVPLAAGACRPRGSDRSAGARAGVAIPGARSTDCRGEATSLNDRARARVKLISLPFDRRRHALADEDTARNSGSLQAR
jgi:hypothetical protein